MDQLNTIITVIFAGILLSSSPGPSMAYVLSRSVQFGHAGGLASSLGLAVGGLIHALLAAMGLALLAVKFPVILQVLKYLGAIYLIYLGYESLRAAFQKQEEDTTQENQPDANKTNVKLSRQTWIKLFKNGVLIELSNPKTILFFISFMPQFIVNHSTLGVFLLSSLIPLSAIPADVIAIFAGGLVASKAKNNYWLVRVINILVALVLISIAIWIMVA